MSGRPVDFAPSSCKGVCENYLLLNYKCGSINNCFLERVCERTLTGLFSPHSGLWTGSDGQEGPPGEQGPGRARADSCPLSHLPGSKLTL